MFKFTPIYNLCDWVYKAFNAVNLVKEGSLIKDTKNIKRAFTQGFLGSVLLTSFIWSFFWQVSYKLFGNLVFIHLAISHTLAFGVGALFVLLFAKAPGEVDEHPIYYAGITGAFIAGTIITELFLLNLIFFN